MSLTTALSFRTMPGNATENEDAYNQSLVMIEAHLLQRVLSRSTGAPPGSPANGDLYIVPASGTTGAWVGQEKKLALYYNGWIYAPPVEGPVLHVDDETGIYVRYSTTAAAWQSVSPGVGDWGVNDQSGTSYQLALSDAWKRVRLANAAAIAVTVPANATAAFAIGTEIAIVQAGAGAVTLAAAGGVTLNTPDDLTLGTQWEMATLTKVAADVWDVRKDLSGAGDADAIHDNVSGEIAAVAEKTSPVSADLILIEDSAASNAKKRVQIGNLPGLSTPAVNARTGTSETLALTDAGDIVTMSNASANTLNIPTNASVAFPVPSIVNVIQLGAGATTITAASGVTLNGVSAGSAAISAQHKAVSLVKIGTDAWNIAGAHGTVA